MAKDTFVDDDATHGTDRGVDAGEDHSDRDRGLAYSAQRLESLEDLTGAQRDAAENVIRFVHKAAVDSLFDRPSGHSKELAAQWRAERFFRRPMNVLVIDGQRGAGKTTLLLTVHRALSVLQIDKSSPTVLSESDRKMFEDLRRLKGLNPPTGRRYGSKQVALCVPLIFPDLMEEGETSMENVCAGIDNHLRRLMRNAETERKQELEALQDELLEEVSVAWTFARRIGEQAVLENALNYEHFVRERAINNSRAYNRVEIWRDFVDKLLDTTGQCLLVLFFDDTDLDPRANEDILKTVRLYCDHPRVVAVLSADMETLTAHLVDRRLAKLITESQALTGIADVMADRQIGLAEEFYDRHVRQARELIRKVLPQNLRFQLDIRRRRDLDLFYPNGMRAFFKRQIIDAWQMAAEVNAQTDTVGRTDGTAGNGGPGRGGDAEGVEAGHEAGLAVQTGASADKLNHERLMERRAKERRGFAFWLLNAPHKWVVGTRSRPIVSFREAVRGGAEDPALELLTMSEQSSVRAELNGDLQALDGAIQSNGIVRVWNIAESYPASALQLPADSKRFDTAFTDFWVDLRITDERCEVGQAHVAASYLPFEVLRRRFSGVYLDVMPADTQGDLGIAKLFPSVPLPRNCLYVYQFRHIYDDLRLARFDGSPVWTYNDSELFRDLESEAIEEAMNERLRASDRSAPDVVIKSLGREFNQSETGTAAVELPTLAALARLANTTTPLTARYFEELPKRLAAIGRKPLGDEGKKLRDQIVAFREKEGRPILNEERRSGVTPWEWSSFIERVWRILDLTEGGQNEP